LRTLLACLALLCVVGCREEVIEGKPAPYFKPPSNEELSKRTGPDGQPLQMPGGVTAGGSGPINATAGATAGGTGGATAGATAGSTTGM
jgi:hypothetical protein